MAYSKPTKTCQDAQLGISSLNAMNASLLAVRDAMALEHGMSEGASPGSGAALGEHLSPRIALASANASLVVLAQTWIVLNGDVTPGVYVSRTGTGVFEIGGLIRENVDGFAIPMSSVASPRFCTCRQAAGLSAASLVRVSCYQLSAGKFTLTDFPFCATIFGRE